MISKPQHAYLVLAHGSPHVLYKLCRRLSGDNVKIFLHIDKKSSIDDFHKVLSINNLFHVEDRVNIFWGGFSIVDATMKLVDLALHKADFARYTLVSGDSYPIISAGCLKALTTSKVNFIDLHKVDPLHWRMKRIRDFFLPDTHIGGLRHGGGLERHMKEECLAGIADIHEKFSRKLTCLQKVSNFYYGQQWWSLTDKFINILYKSYNSIDDPYKHIFRHSCIPDEHYIQTVLGNESQDIFETKRDSIMYTRWDVPKPPYTFSDRDVPFKIPARRHVFVRKIEDSASTLIDSIEEFSKSYEGEVKNFIA